MYCGTPLSGESADTAESLASDFEALLHGEPEAGGDDDTQEPKLEQEGPMADRNTAQSSDSVFAAAMLSSMGVDDDEATDPGTVKLPTQRRPFLMVVDTRGGALAVGQLAKVLGVDGVTAGILARSTWWRPALWGDTQDALEIIADRVRHDLNTKVSVLATADMHGIAAMRGVIRVRDDSTLVLGQSGWRGGVLEPEEGAPIDQRLDDFSLAVPGTVVVRRFRKGVDRSNWSHKKGASQREMGERRVEVVDLHGALHSVRIIGDSTDLAGLPGYQEGSGTISYRLFVDGLSNQLEVLGRRTCHPQGMASAVLDDESPDQTSLTGWKSWEEHSRICALHARRRR